MKLIDFQIRSALAERQWDLAALLVVDECARAFQKYNWAAAMHAARFCTTPTAGKLLEVQIRYGNDVIFWQNGKLGFYGYPVHYYEPSVLIFAPGCL